jgi:hypothetical protein
MRPRQHWQEALRRGSGRKTSSRDNAKQTRQGQGRKGHRTGTAKNACTGRATVSVQGVPRGAYLTSLHALGVPDVTGEESYDGVAERVTWNLCQARKLLGVRKCLGAAIEPYTRCLRHLRANERATLLQLSNDPDWIFDGRGVTFSRDLVEAYFPGSGNHEPSPRLRGEIKSILLDGARIFGNLVLSNIQVREELSLNHVVVQGRVSMENVNGDRQPLGADGLRRGGGCALSFKGANIERNLYISRSSFRSVCLDGLKAQAELFLLNVDVTESASVVKARIDGRMGFHDVGSNGLTTRLQTDVAAARAGLPIIRLEGGRFSGWVELLVRCRILDLTEANFFAGMSIQASYAEVCLDRMVMHAPSILSSHRWDPYRDISGGMPRFFGGPAPRLVSLAGCDVAPLTVAGVDLRPCRFSGAFNLDRLRIDGQLIFHEIRGKWQTRRRAIGDELLWRHVNEPKKGEKVWYPVTVQRSGEWSRKRLLEEEHTANPADRAREISGIYRNLRKSLEDSKNEPAAADFYYGEMEMRRRAEGASVEGLLILVYWAVSGYGLRALRSLAFLALLLILGAICFFAVGFGHSAITTYVPVTSHIVPPRIAGGVAYKEETVQGPRPGWRVAMDYTMQSATSLLREPPTQPTLTLTGKADAAVLRLAGPALLALAVLAIRGRTKR